MAAGGFITGAYKEGMKTNAAVDVRYFKHPDGRVIYITHINGKPMTAVPEGFSQTDTPVEQKVGKVAEEKAAAAGGAGTGAGGGGGSDQAPTTPTTTTGGPSMISVDENNIATPNTMSPGVGKAAGLGLSMAAGMVFGPVAGLLATVFGKDLVSAYNDKATLSAADYNMSREKSSFRASEIGEQNATERSVQESLSNLSSKQEAQAERGSYFGDQTPEADLGFTAEQPGTPAPAPDSRNAPAPDTTVDNSWSPSDSPSSSPASDSGFGTGDSYGNSDYGGYLNKGGFITKKKPDATKSKKGLASRK